MKHLLIAAILAVTSCNNEQQAELSGKFTPLQMPDCKRYDLMICLSTSNESIQAAYKEHGQPLVIKDSMATILVLMAQFGQQEKEITLLRNELYQRQ